MAGGIYLNVCIVILYVCSIDCSKLNVPRVLLPLFKDFSVNFTLEAFDGECLKWTTTRPDLVLLKPADYRDSLDCTSKVVVSSATQDLNRNIAVVLAEDVAANQILRCDVIIDLIDSLSIVTTTRELFMEEAPEVFEVRAYDDQGNEFSSLEGVEFDWRLICMGPNKDLTVLRFITYRESPYETPPSIAILEEQNKRGHIVLLEGIKTGAAQVVVSLPYQEYSHVKDAIVSLAIIANIILLPAEVYVMAGDIVNYKVIFMNSGKMEDITFPNPQYYLDVESTVVATSDRKSSEVSALKEGRTKVVLFDKNIALDDPNIKMPSAIINVVQPGFMKLDILPHHNWAILIADNYDITIEIYSSSNHKLHLGPGVEIQTQIGGEFHVQKRSVNGTWVTGWGVETGVAPVDASLVGITHPKLGRFRFDRAIAAHADIQIYPRISLSPPEVVLPWDDDIRPRFEMKINAVGGDEKFLWSSSNNSIGVVTQAGLVRTHSHGYFEVIAAMQKNHYNRESAKFLIIRPTRLEIVDYIMEAEVGQTIFLHIAMYAEKPDGKHDEQMPLTHCHQLPFNIKTTNPKFVVNKTASVDPVGVSCANIAVVGLAIGSTKVSVTYYKGDEQMEDSVTISAYKPLRMIHPVNKEVVLAVGTSLNLIFTGGPKRFTSQPMQHLRKISSCNNDTVEAYETSKQHEIPGEPDLTVINVLCKKLGESIVTLQISNFPAYSNLRNTGSTTEIKVICGKPRSLIIKPETKSVDEACCPMDLSLNRIVVQNNKNVHLEVHVRDENGRKFLNITSLRFVWQVNPVQYHVVGRADGVVEKLELMGTIPVANVSYQSLQPKNKRGQVTITGTIIGYHEKTLKKIGIKPESPPFLSEDERESELVPIQSEISLLLVDDIFVTPNHTYIYNYPGNRKILTVNQGSGFYNLALSSSELAEVRYMEGSSEIEVLPLKDGELIITLTDLCLAAEPVLINIFIVSVKIVRVEMTDKVEIGKCVESIVKLYDENDHLLSLSDMYMLSLGVHIKNDIISVEKLREDDGNPWALGEVHYIVTGIELGETQLWFSIGSGDHVTESAPIDVQVFPPLRIHPKEGKLLIGATLQYNSKGGPQPESIIEYSTTDDKFIEVDPTGLVKGLNVGTVKITAKSLGINPTTGTRVLYSQDSVFLDIISLSGIKISAPMIRIQVGESLPAWITGLPEKLSPIVLGTVDPPIRVDWIIEDGSVAAVQGIFENTGISNTPAEMISIKLIALSAGRTRVTANATLAGHIAGQSRKSEVMFSSFVEVEVFEGFKLTQPISELPSFLLLAPYTTVQLQTNMDSLTDVTYKLADQSSCPGSTDRSLSIPNPVVTVSSDGLLKSYGLTGSQLIIASCTDENGLKQTINLAVEVKEVFFMMLEVNTKWIVQSAEPIFIIPVGAEFDLRATYHDNTGRKFDAVGTSMQVRSSRFDLINVKQIHDNNTVRVRTRKEGLTVLKVWSDIDAKAAAYVKIHTEQMIGNFIKYITSGDVLCLSTPLVTRRDRSPGKWSSSDRNLVTIDQDTGVARVITTRGGTIQLSNSLHPAASLQFKVFPVSKIVMLPDLDEPVTNTARSVYQVPLVMISDETYHRTGTAKDKNLLNAWQCQEELLEAPMSFLFKCHMKFTNDTIQIEPERVFKIEPNFMYKDGTYCCDILPGPDDGPEISILKSMIAVWATIDGTDIQADPAFLNFMPSLFFEREIYLSEKTFTAELDIHGLKEILDQVTVKSPEENILTISEMTSKTKTIKRFLIKLIDWHWKLNEVDDFLMITVNSPLTKQNVKVRVKVAEKLRMDTCPTYGQTYFSLFLYQYRHFLVLLMAMIVVFLITFYAYSNYVQPVINVNVAPQRSLLTSHHASFANRGADTQSIAQRSQILSQPSPMAMPRGTFNANYQCPEPIYGDASMFYSTSPSPRNRRRYCTNQRLE